MQKKLEKYLDKNTQFHAEYGKSRMSNHLPMALTALFKMGASEQKLDDFYERYVRLLKPKTIDDLKITQNNWQDHLGTHDHNDAYRQFFVDELADKGIETCLRTYLPDLMPGLAAGAFHAMIRLSYALEVEHKDEIAEALAAWAIGYLPLPQMDNQIQTDTANKVDFATILDHMANDGVLNADIVEGKNISTKIETIAQKTIFQKHLNNIQISGPDILDDVSHAMAHLFDKTNGFTVLHGLTSAQAMRDMLPYLDADQIIPSLTTYIQAVSAAYVSVDSPKLDTTLPKYTQNPASWSDMFRKAVTFTDDHKIKLVYSCYKENLRSNFNKATAKADQTTTPTPDIYHKIAHDFCFPPPK